MPAGIQRIVPKCLIAEGVETKDLSAFIYGLSDIHSDLLPSCRCSLDIHLPTNSKIVNTPHVARKK